MANITQDVCSATGTCKVPRHFRLLLNLSQISLGVVIGASLSEPQGVMMSTALACMRACLRTYVRTYVRVGEACLGTSEVWDMIGSLRTSAYTEIARGQERLAAQRGSDHHEEVPEKFFPCTCSYEGEVCA